MSLEMEKSSRELIFKLSTFGEGMQLISAFPPPLLKPNKWAQLTAFSGLPATQFLMERE